MPRLSGCLDNRRPAYRHLDHNRHNGIYGNLSLSEQGCIFKHLFAKGLPTGSANVALRPSRRKAKFLQKMLANVEGFPKLNTRFIGT